MDPPYQIIGDTSHACNRLAECTTSEPFSLYLSLEAAPCQYTPWLHQWWWFGVVVSLTAVELRWLNSPSFLGFVGDTLASVSLSLSSMPLDELQFLHIYLPKKKYDEHY